MVFKTVPPVSRTISDSSRQNEKSAKVRKVRASRSRSRRGYRGNNSPLFIPSPTQPLAPCPHAHCPKSKAQERNYRWRGVLHLSRLSPTGLPGWGVWGRVRLRSRFLPTWIFDGLGWVGWAWVGSGSGQPAHPAPLAPGTSRAPGGSACLADGQRRAAGPFPEGYASFPQARTKSGPTERGRQVSYPS